MTDHSLNSKLVGVLDGYAVRTIHLEQEVEASGYAPVMESLVALATDPSHRHLASPSAEFLGALSAKSKGLMLTSALLADNVALYTPLHRTIDASLGEIYPQDLTSLLGGDHAPKALTEMTRRTYHDMTVLGSFSAGFNQIKASLYTGLSPLTRVKADIADGAWVEKHQNETRNFLTLVAAAPETPEVETLKKGPLTRFLTAGLKLGVVATVVASLGFSAIYGGSYLQTSSGLGYVNLDSRPAIETVMSKDALATHKIIRDGEFDGVKLITSYLGQLKEKSFGDAVRSLSSDKTVGLSTLVEKGKLSDEAICIVSYEQTAPLSKDGHFYKFGDQPGLIVEKNLLDFFMKSHETGHCFFQVDNTDGGVRELDINQVSYAKSLDEIYGDLVAILDHMQETGTNDLYQNYLRPMRVSYVQDLHHKTAWALDVILPELNPAAIQMKDKAELPEIAKHLMEKHFMTKDGGYYPGEMRSKDFHLASPASQAMWNEIISGRKLEYKRFDDPMAQQLAKDIEVTLALHHAKYEGVASSEAMNQARAGYQKLAETYNLKPLETLQVQQAELAKPQESLLQLYL
jgi:hypothetical protein